MRRLLTCLCLASLVAAGEEPAPEVAFNQGVKAFRNNDLSGYFKGLPQAKQAEAEQQWALQRASMGPEDRMKFDAFMVQVQASDAVDRLMSQIQPELAKMNLAEQSGQLMMGSAVIPLMFAQAAAKDPSVMGLATTLQQLLVDIAQWLPKSGLNDPAKARKACESFVAGARALGVKSADELQKLGVAELLKRGDAGIKHMKAMFTVYDINVDAFLDSLKYSTKPGANAAQRDATMAFAAFGKNHQLSMKLKKVGDEWQPDVAGLEQLGKGIGGLGGLGGGAAEEPLAP